jgi:hypothetical protein
MNYMNYGKSRDLSVIWEFRKISLDDGYLLNVGFMNYTEPITSNKGGIIHKFGLVGLFIICFIPFQMTGGLATACFAKLLGFSVREIVPMVFTASFSASMFWALTADTVMDYLGPVQHYIPFFIVFVVMVIIIYNVTHYWKR